MNILVTGANSFIGQALCKKMLADGYQMRGAVRSAAQITALSSRAEGVQVGKIGSDTDWSKALNGVDTAYRNQNIGKRIEERVSRRT